MQLIPQDENKQRRIYNICRFVRYACGTVFLFIVVFSHILFQLNVLLSAVLALIILICLVLIIISFQVPYFLKLTSHFEKPEYKLPHKTKMAREIYLVVSGIFVLALWVILPDLSRISFLVTVIMLLWFLFMYGLLLMISSWNSVVLYEDHLSYSQYWKPFNITYKDINEICITSIVCFSLGPYSIGFNRTYSFTIRINDGSKIPIQINPNAFSNLDLVIILNVIHQFAPQASWNELAEQMRNGNFPVV